jgi:hypothetical protein
MIYGFNILLEKIFDRLGIKVFRQIVGIPIGSHCSPLIAVCFHQFMVKLRTKTILVFLSGSESVYFFL